MNTRKLGLGEKNIVGARVTQMRLKLGMKQIDLLARLQTEGVDISIPALSLLEGQKRPVTDKELKALAEILGVSSDWLLGLGVKTSSPLSTQLERGLLFRHINEIYILSFMPHNALFNSVNLPVHGTGIIL